MAARIILFLAACLVAAPAADSLDVSGTVRDKLESPIPNPRICLLEDTSVCVTGDAGGRFRFVHALASPVRKTPPSRKGLAFRGGSFRVHSEAAATARVEWFDMRGGVMARRMVDLKAGENDLGPAPTGRGLMLVRVRASRDVYLGKAVGILFAAKAGAVVAPGPLSKVANHEQRTLVFSSPGYRTRYEPFFALDAITDEVVHLSAADDSGFHLDQKFTRKVLSLDREKGEIRSEFRYFECAEGSRFARTQLDTLKYAWRDGAMLMWGVSECQGSLLTGAGPDIVGTWNRELLSVHIPLDARLPDCGTSTQTRFNFTSRFRIGEAELEVDLTYEFCAQERYGWQIEEMFGAQTGFVKSVNTCRETVYRNDRGESASVTYTAAGATVSTEFRFQESVCRYWEAPYALEPEACPDPGKARLEDFRSCILGSGFSSP